MRKDQVRKAFEAFCGDWLLPRVLGVYGGKKNPMVHFEVSTIELSYSALNNCVHKTQTRDRLVFGDAKSVLEYTKKVEDMQFNDPLRRRDR